MSQKVFGIDLGTTYSCIATVNDNGEAEVIRNKESENTTPSVVNFADPTTVIVGQQAKDTSVIEPENTVSLVKTLMGRTNFAISYNGEDKSPEEVSSYILRKLTGDAREAINDDVKDVVITCPAYFGTAEVQATKAAGEIAGLNVLEIINEPTAAAIYYGCLNDDQNKTVLVYDLGGGTFDVTIMKIEPGKITMICSDGNHDLGGKNWDNALMNLVAQKFCDAHPEFDGEFDPFEEQDLRIKVENAKKRLTEAATARIAVAGGGSKGQIEITREEFDDITASLLNESLTLTDDCIAVAEKKGYTVEEILLVGGSTKMPQVKAAIMERYQKEPRVLEPDWAVAKGAALYAANLLGSDIFSELKEPIGDPEPSEGDGDGRKIEKLPPKPNPGRIIVTCITSKSYALEAIINDEPKCNNIIVKNETLDGDELSVTKRFGTASANQDNVCLKVYENDFMDEYFEINEKFLLGEATLDLPGNLPELSPIDVTFTIDRQGILTITGVDVTGGGEITAHMQTNAGIMTHEEIETLKKKTSSLVVM